MFDRIEDLKPGSVPYVKSLGYLVVITGVEGDCYTAINSYGRDVLIPKNAEMSFRSEDLRKDNVHFLDMQLYGVSVEREYDALKELEDARSDKEKYYKRIVDNPPQF